jgi:hypothetical protein
VAGWIAGRRADAPSGSRAPEVDPNSSPSPSKPSAEGATFAPWTTTNTPQIQIQNGNQLPSAAMMPAVITQPVT